MGLTQGRATLSGSDRGSCGPGVLCPGEGPSREGPEETLRGNREESMSTANPKRREPEEPQR